MASENSMDEPVILKRGRLTLTPLKRWHLPEISKNLSEENRKEITLLGYDSVDQALDEMFETTESYIVRKDDGKIISVGGLWFMSDQDSPQMFCMFTNELRKNFTGMARGSLMLVNFFDRSQDRMTMTILAEHEAMVNWALWLGFEAVGIYEHNGNQYVDFVRCNPNQNYVYDDALRPAMH